MRRDQCELHYAYFMVHRILGALPTSTSAILFGDIESPGRYKAACLMAEQIFHFIFVRGSRGRNALIEIAEPLRFQARAVPFATARR